MVISGMAGASQLGNESFRHSGGKSSEPTVSETNVISESCVHLVGRLSVSGNTNLPKIGKPVYSASLKWFLVFERTALLLNANREILSRQS
jgi:hypothetical protein